MKKTSVAKALIFLVFFVVHDNRALATDTEEFQLKKEDIYKVVKKKDKKEIEKFASWFHQDWQLIFSDFNEGKEQYMSSLTLERKSILKKELEIFLDKNKELSQKSLIKKWLNLGAQGWDSDFPMYETLKSFSESLSLEELN